MSKTPAPGDTFGRYLIVRVIGEGGMATVYEARDVDLHKRVALKVLHPWLALRLAVVQRFVLEARAASRFSHDHVVGITELGSIDHVPFIVMDLLEGECLSALLDRGGPLPLPRLAAILLPVLSAVAAAHEAGVLHRDLKPDNVFLARRRRSEHAVLLDFGISKLISGGPAQPLTEAGEVLGTPAYMSPEQVLKGMSFFTDRSDQYALGVVLHECATGVLPFRDLSSVNALMRAVARGGAPRPSSLQPGLPAAFDALVTRAMSLDPADRFPSVLDLGQALLAFADARTVSLWSDDFSPDTPRDSLRAVPVPLSPADLRTVPLLASFADADLTHLLSFAPPQRFAPKSALFDQGGPGGACFLLVSGEVEISRTHGADTWEIAAVGPGTLLGLTSLWDQGPRPVAAIARTECVALSIKRTALEPLGAECPAIADRLLEEAATAATRRLAGAETRVAELLDRGSGEVSRETLVRLAAAIGEWSLPIPTRGR